MRFARKINKIPEFYTFFARKNSFCPNLGGSCPPSSRLLYAYGVYFKVFKVESRCRCHILMSKCKKSPMIVHWSCNGAVSQFVALVVHFVGLTA